MKLERQIKNELKDSLQKQQVTMGQTKMAKTAK